MKFIIGILFFVLVSFRCYIFNLNLFFFSQKVLVSFRCYPGQGQVQVLGYLRFSFFSLLPTSCTVMLEPELCFSFFSLLRGGGSGAVMLFKVLVSFRCYSKRVIENLIDTMF